MSRHLSPTGKLLRSSRLFSVPAPLQPSSHELVNSAGAADIGSSPYPRYQAITTPESSRARGDWGLKRPLPLRSTANTSTPSLRVKSHDTWEHVTDFESAADHTQTLQKWQEMHIPVYAYQKRMSIYNQRHDPRAKPNNVFESKIDNTDPEVNEKQRWKFQGPWIGGMSEEEFESYLLRDVRHRKKEFMLFVEKRVAEDDAPQRQLEATHSGTEADSGPIKFTQEEVEEAIRAMRDGFENLSSKLSRYIREFFDLAPFIDTPGMSGGNYGDADTGPPPTHPSAGLSYLRSRAFMQNNPLLGPQAESTPVAGRVLQTRDQGARLSGSNSGNRIGIGGVVASVNDAGYSNDKDGKDSDVPGGKKAWVTPLEAHIEPSGKIGLHAKIAAQEAREVHMKRVGSTNPQRPQQALPAEQVQPMRRERIEGFSAAPGMGQNQQSGPPSQTKWPGSALHDEISRIVDRS